MSRQMNWKTIRLELGCTPEFPVGSAGRAYLIRLPVEECGSIDEAAMECNPEQATVRRFWPSQPDRAGRVTRAESGWELQWNGIGSALLRLESGSLSPGKVVTIVEPGGPPLPFRVASMRELA